MNGLEQLDRLWRSLAALGGRRLAALGIVGLTVFSAVGLGSYYLSRPEFETLYAGLNAQDVSRIGAALKEAGIAFDVNSEGTKVMVRAQQTAQARMLLAEKGLPSSANAGYELFDKLGSIGLTSFMQEITRVRALEGELARTIQAMKGVRAARVHVVLPDGGSFRRTRQPPSASVVIRTDRQDDFSSAQAIRHLVSAAIPGMSIDQVRVLTTDGTVLAAGGDMANAVPGTMVELEKTIAKELQDNVRKTLAPYLGLDNFTISVAARLNMDKRQINETSFDPESRAERSLRVVKETGSSQNSANRPAVGVEQNVPSEQTATAGGDQSKRSNERREELRNYELSSKTISTVSEGYKIENLTVAVVINRKRLMASLGDSATPEAVDKQIKEIQGLVESATGIDSKRGDRVAVSAVDFVQGGALEEAVAGPGILEQLLQQTGALVKGLTILAATALLIFFGLKPAMRAILSQAPAPAVAAGGGAPQLTAEGGASAELPGTGDRRNLSREVEPNLIADLTSKMGRSPQKRLEQMIEYDEEQAAAILKQWMRGARSA
ncbi:MAG: flagellar M-ring protein FliF [Sphingomonadales bacterium]|nr:flagellar M-ring protein FliF [Sphingomonadales bacterium]